MKTPSNYGLEISEEMDIETMSNRQQKQHFQRKFSSNNNDNKNKK